MAGDSCQTHNTQINKVIGENKKSAFYFMGETIQTLWPTQYKHSLRMETNWVIIR